MNLLEQAVADARAILRDSATGFGREITLTTPEQVTVVVTGLWSHRSQELDPQTGVVVTGNFVHVTFDLAQLRAAGIKETPRAVPERSRYKWIVRVTDMAGNRHTFAVREATPNTTLDIVLCKLEAAKE